MKRSRTLLITLLLALLWSPLALAKGAGIIATIPARASSATIKRMAQAAGKGRMIARVNLHTTNLRQARKLLPEIAKVAKSHGVKLMLDLPGGMARTDNTKGTVSLKRGDSYQLTSGGRHKLSGQKRAWVGHKRLAKDLSVGDRIFVDGGNVKLRVTSIVAGKVNTKVVKGGTFGNKAVLSIDKKDWTFPNMVRRDQRALKSTLAVAREAGFKNKQIVIANSMASSPETVAALDRALARENGRAIERFVKIENNAAVKNTAALTTVADKLIVARNDLGIAVGKPNLEKTQARIARTVNPSRAQLVIGGAFLPSMKDGGKASAADIKALRTARDLGQRFVLLTPTAKAKAPEAIVAKAKQLLDESPR